MAGLRIDPPPSDPTPKGTRPAATAAAVPPLLPPGVRVRSHGLRVVPNVTLSVNGQIVISGTFVFPITIAPAARSRRTTSASCVLGRPVGRRAPGRHLAGHVDVVLDRHRDAEQRQPLARVEPPLGVGRLGPRRRSPDDPEGVQRRIESLDPLEVRFEQRGGCDLPRRQVPRLRRRAGEHQLVQVHAGAVRDQPDTVIVISRVTAHAVWAPSTACRHSVWFPGVRVRSISS